MRDRTRRAGWSAALLLTALALAMTPRGAGVGSVPAAQRADPAPGSTARTQLPTAEPGAALVAPTAARVPARVTLGRHRSPHLHGAAAPATTPPLTAPVAPPAVPASRTAPSRTAPSGSTPSRLRIPTLGVDAALIPLGLQADGSWEVPADGTPAGWYTGGPAPGARGPAVIAGHVDWGGRPGVFAALRRLQPGAQVTVARVDGSTAVFQVTSVQEFPKSAFPTGLVYGHLDGAGLRLITCGGSFDPAVGSYEDNIVAFAQLVGSTG